MILELTINGQCFKIKPYLGSCACVPRCAERARQAYLFPEEDPVENFTIPGKSREISGAMAYLEQFVTARSDAA